MTANRLKLGCAVTFMKYLASVVPLIFLTKPLIWNKIYFSTLNLMNLPELVENEPLKCIYQKLYQNFFFCLIYNCLMQRFQELLTKELDNFTKILISIVFD